MLQSIKQHGINMLRTKCNSSLYAIERLTNFNVCQQRHLSEQNTLNNSNKRSLKGKVAVITASTDGIGLSIAKRLAEDGANVMISSRKQTNVDKAVEELRKLNLNVSGIKCHVSDRQDRKNLFEETIRKYGKINILVSNAAVNPDDGGILSCEEVVWDKIFDINVKSSFLLSKECLPYLRKEANSNIVYISSISAYDALGHLGTYTVSKVALVSLTKEAAKDLSHEGIRVNCVAPGVIETKFSKCLRPDEAAKVELLKKIPMNRFGSPDEVAGVVSFLVSDDASYITGETIVAAGGVSGRL